MRVVLHVQGIAADHVAHEGEETTALMHGLLEVDGYLLDEAGKVEVTFEGGSFLTVKPLLLPGSFEVISHTEESWPELVKRIDEQRVAVTGTGRTLAAAKDSPT